LTDVIGEVTYLRLIRGPKYSRKGFWPDTKYSRQKWVDNLKTVGNEHIKLAIVTANNH